MGPALLLAAWLAAQEPLSPAETVARFKLPEGFSATLFAGEPDLRQPISFCIDDRGRLWIIEGNSYPAWKPGGPDDRVWIYEDSDLDGRFDRRTLFLEGLRYATGIEVGFGGAWIVAPPRMIFVPDRDGDDRPDGPAEVLLDGFGTHGGHNVVNGFTWGPDGWLYAGHGRTSISDLGPPGTPPEDRIHFDGGIWRYHPVRRVFEAFSDGTTNPWGVAFDAQGRLFVSNCVTAHLFHIVQGAHYEPWRDRPSSRYAYGRVAPCADHAHFGPALRGAGNDALGGGHAHSGCMVYLGGAWPERYRGAIFMSNLHGHRINMDLPGQMGSGIRASHGPDFLVSGDPMFTGLLLQYGPDGSVFVSDWYDRGECHTLDPHRASGRIYKISHGTPERRPVDLARLSDADLVRLQGHPNEWFTTHARRLLQERCAAGPRPGVHEALRALLKGGEAPRRLRALWALHVTGGLDPADRLALLADADPWIRAWTLQLELEDREAPAEAVAAMTRLAVEDPDPVVRQYLAAAARRLPADLRLGILHGLAARAEDASDPVLPLLTWYAMEPLVAESPALGADFLKRARIPLLREYTARRMAARSGDRPVVNVASFGAAGDGTTNDAKAFQAAIDRLGTTGGRVLVPWGVRPYRIATTLRIGSSHLELHGPGAQLKLDAGAALRVEGPIEDVALGGLRLAGAGPGPALDISGAATVELRDLQVRGGARIAGARRIQVSQSRFEALDLDLRGADEAELRGVTVERTLDVAGDRSRLRTENCRLPKGS